MTRIALSERAIRFNTFCKSWYERGKKSQPVYTLSYLSGRFPWGWSMANTGSSLSSTRGWEAVPCPVKTGAPLWHNYFTDHLFILPSPIWRPTSRTIISRRSILVLTRLNWSIVMRPQGFKKIWKTGGSTRYLSPNFRMVLCLSV